MKRSLLFLTFVLMLALLATPASAGIEVIPVQRVGDVKELPDGSTVYYAEVEETVRMFGMDLPRRILIHCRNASCTAHSPSSDELVVNKTRVVIFTIVVSGIVVHAVWGGGGSAGGGVGTTAGGGGGGCPPACGGGI